MQFRLDDVTHPAVIALLEEHVADMYATSPAESVHTLDLGTLRGDGIEVWTAWRDDVLLGCGALKELSATDRELKSMRTTHAARGQGVGAAMLTHLIDQAQASGATHLWLETGVEEYFAAARRLYERAGFVGCEPFADYVEDPLSVFMTLELSSDSGAINGLGTGTMPA